MAYGWHPVCTKRKRRTDARSRTADLHIASEPSGVSGSAQRFRIRKLQPFSLSLIVLPYESFKKLLAMSRRLPIFRIFGLSKPNRESRRADSNRFTVHYE
jgi:hypothetical protein